MVVAEHGQAIAIISELLRESGTMTNVQELGGIGHRVVHGGESFHELILIDEAVIETIKELVPLAPLHNPASLTGIRVAMEHADSIPQVAVFDTLIYHLSSVHSCTRVSLRSPLYTV